MSALPLASACLSNLWILLDRNLCKISYNCIFSLFILIFKHDFIRRVDFTYIEAANTTSDDVTN